MTTITTAWMLGFACGFLPFLAVVASRRRPRGNGNCEPMPPAPPYSSAAIAWQAEAEASRAKFIDPSMGEPWDEGTTPPPKPQPPGGRVVDASGMTIGYRPLPWPGPTTPPPREP